MNFKRTTVPMPMSHAGSRTDGTLASARISKKLLWMKMRCTFLFPNALYLFLCRSNLSSWRFSQVTWYKASDISHCWCGRERSKQDIDECGLVFECSRVAAKLLSVCHPGNDELNKEHEVKGSVPSCKFDETFCSLIPSWLHICDRSRR